MAKHLALFHGECAHHPPLPFANPGSKRLSKITAHRNMFESLPEVESYQASSLLSVTHALATVPSKAMVL